MEAQDELFDRVRQYFRNQLSPEEREAFEKQYRDDATFATKAEEYIQFLRGVDEYGTEALRSSLTQRYKDQQAKKNAGVISLRKVVLIAATLLLLVSIPFSFWYFNRSISLDALYSNSFDPLAAPAIRDQGSGSVDTLWTEALKRYDAADYKEAVILLETITSEPTFPEHSKALLYKGLSYMMLDQPVKALHSFEPLMDTESTFRDDALWYGALAHLKIKEKEQAISILETIQEKGSTHYRKKSAALLKKLKR